MVTKPKRRWYRWRWLPLLVALLSVGVGWLGFKWKEANERPIYLRGTNGDDASYYFPRPPGGVPLQSPDIEPDRIE